MLEAQAAPPVPSTRRFRAQDYVELGIGQARRGWLTKDDVVNARSWEQLEKIRRKRP